jgi:A/G-specific adenine glycosylase
MTEVPTTSWSKDFDDSLSLAGAPKFDGLRQTQWKRVAGVVRHVFTHFPLELSVYVAELPAKASAPQAARWVALDDLSGEAFPTLMRKVIAHGLNDRVFVSKKS